MRILMYLHMQSKFKTNNNGDGNGNTTPTYLDLVLFDKFQISRTFWILCFFLQTDPENFNCYDVVKTIH